MKKYLIIPILLLFAGCSNWLDLLPKNEQVTADYWKTKEDVEAVVASGYYYMREATPYLIDWGEVRGGSVISRMSSEKGKLQNFQLVETSSLCKWDTFYQVINMANSVIEYAPQVQAVDATYSEAAVKSHQTEAYFMRALMYFYLVRNYKEVPLVLSPYVDDSAEYEIAKSTEEEIIARIKDDLTTAIQMDAAKEFFDNTWGTKGRVTKWALYALMADVCLWSEDYANCVIYANLLLDATSPYRPAFMSMSEQWFTIFNPGNSNESIFELNWDGTTYGQTEKSPSNYYDFSTSSIYVYSEAMTKRLAEDAEYSYSMGQEPVRSEYGAYSMGTSSDGGETIYAMVWKYMGTDVKDYAVVRSQMDGNYIIYRMADVLLMKAEALIWQGPEHWETALEIINQIRRRAYVPELDLTLAEETEASMLGYVLHERDIELAAEGKRWYDLVRFGKSKNYEHKSLFVELIVENNSTANDSWIRSVLRNEYAWYLPIPFSELEVNGKLVQNPYYKTTN